jgi:hypothetical protein
MPKKNIHRKKVAAPIQTIPTPQATSKNLMGLSGIAMILLTNYQTEIKKTFEILYGFLK